MMTAHTRTLILLSAVSLLALGCDRNNTNPNDPSQVNIEFVTTDLVVGTGDPAVVGNTATVNYTGWLYNAGGPESKGLQFATSLEPGGTPLVVTIGRREFIAGFEQGLIGMRAGGKRRVYIPSELAFGPSGSGDGTIPPNAAVVFEVDMLNLVQ